MEEKSKNRNASPSAYGWVFQVGAGITLMLENIKDFSSLKMEGKNDDIEITLPDGKLFAQAKSVTQIGDSRSSSTNLNGALDVFKDDLKNAQENVVKLVYVSNIINPLLSSYPSAFEYGNTYDFSTLPTEDQNKIIEKLGPNFPVEKLQIKILRFFGEGYNKWTNVKNQIAEFLRQAIDDPTYDKILLDSWISEFITNCADKPQIEKSLEINKKDIIFPLIILVTENTVTEKIFSEVSDYDDFEGLSKKFREVLYRKKCDYQFVSKIIGDYNSASTRNRYDYVNSYWGNYLEDFCFVGDDEEKEALIKLSVLSILLQKSTINKIRKEANL